MNRPYLDGWLAEQLGGEELLSWAQARASNVDPKQVYRQREGRVTLRLELGGRDLFLKLHRGVGWKEVFKNLLQFRLPVTGAGTEFRALVALQRAGIECPPVLGYAGRGINPSRRLSALVTEALCNAVDLQAYCRTWVEAPPEPTLRWALIESVAAIARTMHDAGINHRDFYLWHVFLDPTHPDAPGPGACSLLDPHRARLRGRLPRRWRCKDLGALYFSALSLPLTRRDLLRFIRAYSRQGLRQELGSNRHFWLRVQQRGHRSLRRERAQGRL